MTRDASRPLLLVLALAGLGGLAGCTLDLVGDDDDDDQAAPACGDGVLDPGEVCDDGNTASGDGCAALCDSNEICGNAILDIALGEQCDDGNNVNGDACDATCRLPVAAHCGNGIVDPGEQCDGAGQTVTCDADCTVALCGDGLLNVAAGEQCDDGNNVDGDGCRNDCRLP